MADYDTIRKLARLTKYQKPEFIAENNLDKVDVYLSTLDPTKRQYKTFWNVIIPTQIEIKKKFAKAIEKFFDVRKELEEVGVELFWYKNLFYKSQIFTDKQLVESNGIGESLKNKKISMDELWGLEKVERSEVRDLTKHHIYGNLAKK